PGSAFGSATAEGIVEVVGEDGRIWKATLVSVDETGTTLKFLFLDRLPRGRYEVRLTDSSGLVDLAGRTPVADGQADRVLGRFGITSEPASRKPNDLGALLPNRASAGVSQPIRIASGQESTIRLVITQEALYR